MKTEQRVPVRRGGSAVFMSCYLLLSACSGESGPDNAAGGATVVAGSGAGGAALPAAGGAGNVNAAAGSPAGALPAVGGALPSDGGRTASAGGGAAPSAGTAGSGGSSAGGSSSGASSGGLSSGGASSSAGAGGQGGPAGGAAGSGGSAGTGTGLSGNAGTAGTTGTLTFSSEGDGDAEISSPFNLPRESTTLNAGVTAGQVRDFTWSQSQVFPGTSRLVRVYTPSGHDGTQPAALSVLQDGNAYIDNFRMTRVLDNLIAARTVPTQIAVFIAASANRSAEYDCLNDNYFRFVTEEILPEVERRFSVKISTDPWQRAIGGHSSGGSAAFTVGWRHADSFRRILTHNGSFTDLCRAGSNGAHTYPGLVTAAEPKPLRVFLLTGTNDNGAGTNGTRDWVKMNRDMAAALKGKGYHYRFVFANGGSHSQNAGASILPDTLRWLWRPGM